MGCPPVRRDIPRALASGLYYISVDLAHHEIFHAKDDKIYVATRAKKKNTETNFK